MIGRQRILGENEKKTNKQTIYIATHLVLITRETGNKKKVGPMFGIFRWCVYIMSASPV